MLIVLPIENKLRELNSKLLLAYNIISKSNHEVLIGGQRFFKLRIKDFKNAYFFDKNTYHERLSDLVNYKKNKVLSLDEEGPVYLFDQIGRDYRLNKKFIKKIHKYLFWGKEDYAIFNNKKFKKKENIIGHPKFDLLENPINKIFLKEKNFIKKKYKKFVLFCSSFEDFSDTAKNHEISIIKNLYKHKNTSFIKNKIDQIIKLKNIHQYNYDQITKLLYSLSKNNPNINFIFRKHPHENDYEVKKRFKNFPSNFFIDFKYTVTPWIMACNLYINSGCTTIFEAIKLEKKIITCIPKNSDIRLKKISELGNYFKNIRTCNKIINKFLNGHHDIKKIKSSVMYNIKKKVTFSNKFIHLLENKKKLLSSIHYTENYQPQIYKFFYKFIKLSKIFLSYLKNKIIIKTFLIKYMPEKYIFSKKNSEKKFKSLKTSEIKSFFKKIDNLLNKKNNFFYYKICDSVFLISKKKKPNTKIY